MPRKSRDLVAGGVYHVWARGNLKAPIFHSDDDREQYLVTLGLIVRECGWLVLAYCLMGNHVHLLVETPRPNLYVGIREAHKSYARYFNEQRGEVGHLFERRFGSNRAMSAGAAMYISAYIALNPVRAAMCARPEQHPWSSHGAVVGVRSAPSWFDASHLLRHFESPEMTARDRYSAIVDAVRVLGAAGLDAVPGT